MWNAEYDVVVVGTGFAGLAAAIEARERGRSVVVLEKMRNPGGNSIISGGLVAAAGSDAQRLAGIEDSPDRMLADMLAAGQHLNDPTLTRMVAEHSAEVFGWLRDHLHVEFRDGVNQLGGHAVPRTCATAKPAGIAIIRPMLERCRELEIEVRLRSQLRSLVQDAGGRVVGVEVQDEYHFPEAESGETIRIRANGGVVLASGGFARDAGFRRIQDPRLDAYIDSTNHPGATSEGLVAALVCGATPVHLSWIQLGPWASEDEKGWGVGSLFSILAGFPYGIMVDAASGRRFVNELSDRKLRVDAMLQQDRHPVAIVDSGGVSRASTLEQCLKRGVVREYQTLEELARDNGIPTAALRETVSRYNASLEQGVDVEFGKPLLPDLAPLSNPPFYAIRLVPKVHHCMGGIQIDTEARVLHLVTRAPIAGLYAAGEVTGGIHGASRLGSCAIPDCLVFGRLAGMSAASGR